MRTFLSTQLDRLTRRLEDFLLAAARKRLHAAQRAVDNGPARFNRLMREYDKEAAAMRASYEQTLRIGMMTDERRLIEAKRELEAIEDSVWVKP